MSVNNVNRPQQQQKPQPQQQQQQQAASASANKPANPTPKTTPTNGQNQTSISSNGGTSQNATNSGISAVSQALSGDKSWNSNPFQGGRRENGYNNGGSNFMQAATASSRGDRTSGLDTFERSTTGGNQLVDATGSDKITSLSRDGKETSMKRQADGNYKMTSGETMRNFDNGSQSDRYGSPNGVNLQHSKEGETIEKDAQVKQEVSEGKTNETSKDGRYNTEAYFRGKDGNTLGVGANTKDDKTAADAQKEVNDIGKDFSKKDESGKSQLDKMSDMAKGNKEAQDALKQFKDAMYEKTDVEHIKQKPDDEGNYTINGQKYDKDGYALNDDGSYKTKDFTNDAEGAKEAAKQARDAAQNLNNALRNDGMSQEDENTLNDTLKGMTAADSAIRDVAEGDEPKDNGTAVLGDNNNNSQNNEMVNGINNWDPNHINEDDYNSVMDKLKDGKTSAADKKDLFDALNKKANAEGASDFKNRLMQDQNYLNAAKDVVKDRMNNEGKTADELTQEYGDDLKDQIQKAADEATKAMNDQINKFATEGINNQEEYETAKKLADNPNVKDNPDIAGLQDQIAKYEKEYQQQTNETNNNGDDANNSGSNNANSNSADAANSNAQETSNSNETNNNNNDQIADIRNKAPKGSDLADIIDKLKPGDKVTVNGDKVEIKGDSQYGGKFFYRYDINTGKLEAGTKN